MHMILVFKTFFPFSAEDWTPEALHMLSQVLYQLGCILSFFLEDV